MIVHRDGRKVAMCDRCHRIAAPGEAFREVAGLPAAAAVDSVVDARGVDHPVPKVQPAQPAHRCPRCGDG